MRIRVEELGESFSNLLSVTRKLNGASIEDKDLESCNMSSVSLHIPWTFGHSNIKASGCFHDFFLLCFMQWGLAIRQYRDTLITYDNISCG